MLREDYILAWIRRYIQWIAEIAGLVKVEDYISALRRVDLALRSLLDLPPDSVTSLSEGEILARLSLGDPEPSVQEKCAVLSALLKQLGQVCAANGRLEQSREAYLKALQIVLGLKLQGEPPALAPYVPSVEGLLELLRGHPVPARTSGALMIYFENARQFGRAEDALFALLDASTDGSEAIEVGLGFYRRLGVLSDEVLLAGDLPRDEVAAGLAELQARAHHAGAKT